MLKKFQALDCIPHTWLIEALLLYSIQSKNFEAMRKTETVYDNTYQTKDTTTAIKENPCRLAALAL